MQYIWEVKWQITRKVNKPHGRQCEIFSFSDFQASSLDPTAGLLSPEHFGYRSEDLIDVHFGRLEPRGFCRFGNMIVEIWVTYHKNFDQNSLNFL